MRKDMQHNRDAIGVVDEVIIDRMVDRLVRQDLDKAALCLHRSPDDGVHEMLNVFGRRFYAPPHRHPLKSETKTILRGRLLIVVFDDAGQITRRIILGDPATRIRIVRLEKNLYHTNLPLDEIVVFLETTTGPYLGPDDSDFASWAPCETDPQAAAYKRRLEEGA
ncbi:MAG: WbuC family cupin fold metalloprotein [Lentisphaerae bacterium]|nr:WbuC family cupin fold metalloprotein [Lentisphaerota bacterium]